jgi:hypothetical protein
VPSNSVKKMLRLGSLRQMQPFVLFVMQAKKKFMLLIVRRFY